MTVAAVSGRLPPDCSDLAMRIGLRTRPDSAGGVPALFAGRRVGYCFNARVAIRTGVGMLGLAPGDEVLVPAYNCGSEIDPLLHAGLTVSLYPVSMDGGVDPEMVAAQIGPRTRAIYLTHYFGFLNPAASALRALCDARDLRLIEDCALSLLSGEHPAEGRWGDIAVFCFYKFLPVLAGGALAINASDVAGTPSFERPPPAGVVARRVARAGLAAGLGRGRSTAILRRLRPPAADPIVAEGLADMPGHYYFDPALQGARISGSDPRCADRH